MAAEVTLNPVCRGDAIIFSYANMRDQAGGALTLSDWDIRCALKLPTDTADNDSSALAVITDGSGITVSGASITEAIFPASATEDVAPGTILKADVQLTLSANANKVITPLRLFIPIEQDVTKTSP